MAFESPLNTNTYIPYASHNYKFRLYSSSDEFKNDIRLLSVVKRALRKYHKSGDIKLQLLMNHIIILRNIFSTIPADRLLFFYCDTFCYPALKTILTHLNMCPHDIPEVRIQDIKYDDNLIDIIRTHNA